VEELSPGNHFKRNPTFTALFPENMSGLKNTSLFSLLCLILLTAAFSCKTARRAQAVSLKPKGEKALMKHLLENQVNAEWLSAKARITYSDEYGKETFSANIRICKDSLIWMNFKKFSIEGGRALITPDSIYVVDRINGEYAIKPFDMAARDYNLPVGFQGLQALLLGNPVFFSSETTASVDSTRYLLSQKTDRFLAKYWLDGASMLLREFMIEDLRSQRKMNVTSSDYQQLEDKQKFSYFRTFNLKSLDLGEMKVEIAFSKVEINVPKSIEFEIPSRYNRVD
jgi:hypothetical protein